MSTRPRLRTRNVLVSMSALSIDPPADRLPRLVWYLEPSGTIEFRTACCYHSHSWDHLGMPFLGLSLDCPRSPAGREEEGRSHSVWHSPRPFETFLTAASLVRLHCPAKTIGTSELALRIRQSHVHAMAICELSFSWNHRFTPSSYITAKTKILLTNQFALLTLTITYKSIWRLWLKGVNACIYPRLVTVLELPAVKGLRAEETEREGGDSISQTLLTINVKSVLSCWTISWHLVVMENQLPPKVRIHQSGSTAHSRLSLTAGGTERDNSILSQPVTWPHLSVWESKILSWLSRDLITSSHHRQSIPRPWCMGASLLADIQAYSAYSTNYTERFRSLNHSSFTVSISKISEETSNSSSTKKTGYRQYTELNTSAGYYLSWVQITGCDLTDDITHVQHTCRWSATGATQRVRAHTLPEFGN